MSALLGIALDLLLPSSTIDQGISWKWSSHLPCFQEEFIGLPLPIGDRSSSHIKVTLVNPTCFASSLIQHELMHLLDK